MRVIKFRQGPKLLPKLEEKIFDGHRYYCYRTTGVQRFIRCYLRRSEKCPAQGQMLNGRPDLSRNHNHEPNPALKSHSDFQKALYNATIARPFHSLRLIYDNLSIQYPNAAVEMPWSTMGSVMERWRRNIQPYKPPPVPNDLIHYATIVNLPQWQRLTQSGQSQLSVVTLQAADNSILTVFYNRDFVAKITTNTVFMDATFKIRPAQPKTYQFFTVLALINNTALPIYWMLMTKKSTEAYRAGFSYFKEHVGQHIQLDIIMTDFEAALRNAIAHEFPESTHTGCYFHFCQAITKRIKKLGLLRFVTNTKVGQVLVRKFMALPLLPAHDIPVAFEWIVNNMPQYLQILFHDFVRYFRRQWILSISPEIWSVYNYQNRTNNYSESYNKTQKLRFGVKPGIWKFTEALVSLQALTEIEHMTVVNGAAIGRKPRSQVIERDRNIKRAWMLYSHNVLDIPNFLAYASHILNAFQKEIIIVVEQDEEGVEVAIIPDDAFAQFDVNYLHLPLFMEINIV